jgi:aminoglycoside phosphotransferase (APT) family kinase protein
MKANSEFVHRLLDHLETCRFDGAPRFLGIDEKGREVLSFIDGIVPFDLSTGSEDVWADTALTEVFGLLRRFHDATAGTGLAGSEEVVLHGDPSPRNTVYRAGRPVAFIDFDLARSGRRLTDVAQAIWQFLDLGSLENRDLAQHRRRIPMLCDAYGLEERSGLIEEIIAVQTATLDRLVRAEELGDVAAAKLIRGGAIDSVRREREWTIDNRPALEAALP